MSIAPEDWREWTWFATPITGLGLLVEVDWRIWRVTVTGPAGAGSTTVEIFNAGPIIWTIPSGVTQTIEPRGMLTGPLTVGGVAPQSGLIEWLVRN